MPTLEEIMRHNRSSVQSAATVDGGPPQKAPARKGRPPLSGERMSKAEYQRRYRAKKKAERHED